MGTFLIISAIVISIFLCITINKWYIEPYEDLMYQKSIDDMSHKTIIESKNQLINKMSIEIEELKAKLKESKKKSIKKSTKRRILEVFPTKK